MTTTTRAQVLAGEFAAAHQDVLAAVESLPADSVHRSAGEGWPVFFAAWHIADGYRTVMGLVSLVAGGQPLPEITREMLDAGNAANLARYGGCTRDDALTALRENGAWAEAAIRPLTDEQLDRTATLALFGGATLSVTQLIEAVLIGHTRGHLAGLSAAA